MNKNLKFYILKILTEELVNTKGPAYTIEMYNEAKSKTLFNIENNYDCKLDECAISDPNHFLKIYIVKQNWIEPAPQHLIVAARLRGEI